MWSFAMAMGTCQSRRLKDDTSIAEKWRYESGLEEVAIWDYWRIMHVTYRDCGVMVLYDDSAERWVKIYPLSPGLPLWL
jgi:hypothetical protein